MFTSDSNKEKTVESTIDYGLNIRVPVDSHAKRQLNRFGIRHVDLEKEDW